MKIFFDLDGTLIDVSKRHYQVYRESVSLFDGKPLDRATYWELKRSKTLWPELLRMSGLSPNILDGFLERFKEKIESPDYLKLDTLLPDTLATLDWASAQYTCLLVSLRRNQKNLRSEVKWLDIGQYFEKVLSGHSETDGSDKKVELVRSELQNHEKAIIVGDTEADIKTGKQLDMATIAVLSGIRNEQFLAALRPDYIVSDISKLASLTGLSR